MELDRTSIHAGTPVYSSDGEHVGDVEDVGSTYIRARKGWFFVKERYIPFTAIVRFDGDGVYLSVAKDQLDAMAWDAPPAETDGSGTPSARGYAATRSATAGTYDTTAADTTAAQRTWTTDRDAGAASVASSDTVLSERVAGLPVRTSWPAAFQHGTFEVRARHEELTVRKEARVIEELVVTTQAVERVQPIQDTVRRTGVDITEVAESATAATIHSDLASLPGDTAGSSTAAGGAYIASTPEDTDVSKDPAAEPQPRTRRRRRR